jgi:hypothetical protein
MGWDAPVLLNELLLYFGGAQIALAALVGFLGRVWLNRIRERDKGSVLSKIEELKADLAATNERLRSTLEKGVHIHRVQFDAEFAAYRDVWDGLVEIANAALKLRPAMDRVPLSKEERDAERMRRLQDFDNANRLFRQKVHKMRPFYDESVFSELSEFLKLVRSEAADYAYKDQPGDAEYWEKALKNAEEIPNRMNAVCDRIRSRIREMNPVD